MTVDYMYIQNIYCYAFCKQFFGTCYAIHSYTCGKPKSSYML